MRNRTAKGIVVLVFGIITAAALPGGAIAAGFSPVTVEYSADRVISSDSGSMTGKVYSAQGKERNEFGGGDSVTIMRSDRKLVWILMPKDRKYMEHKAGEGKEGKREAGNYEECDIKQTGAGEETVNGFRTRKNLIEISCPDREKFSGTLWLTKENIVMKMETAAKTEGSKKQVFRLELKNLKIGKQDPALFEIPPGYQKFEIPTMGDVQKMWKDEAAKEERRQKEAAKTREEARAKEKEAESGRSYTAQPREQSPLDQNINRAKKLKNLLGW